MNSQRIFWLVGALGIALIAVMALPQTPSQRPEDALRIQELEATIVILQTPKPVPVVEVVVEEIKQRIHTVAKGETLSAISTQYYGNGNKWEKIYAANKSMIPNKNQIRPGTVLVIPE